jgi:hypothetical protein
MLYEIKQISKEDALKEQVFVILIFVSSVILSFLFGYVLFRYWQIDVCKIPMKIGDFG